MSSQQPDSLVKYDTPILVSTSVTGKKSQKKKQQQLAPLEKTTTTRNEDYLNSILPPREYTENGQLWVRYVSPTPATRVDVINLQDELDKRLQARQARETGICPIREELYA
jgi:dynein light intermediate chain